MGRRILHAFVVALAVVLPATLARASGAAVADCGRACQDARVDFWQPTADTVDVWLTAVAPGRLVTGTFRFYVGNYVFSTVKSVRQTSGSKPACAIQQVTYGVVNPTQVPVLVCTGLNLPAGAKLALELPVTPRAGVTGSVIGDYDFGGTGLPQQAASWSPKPLPEFTVKATWLNKRGGKLQLLIKNVGSVAIKKLKVYGKSIKRVISWRRIQTVGENGCASKPPYVTCSGPIDPGDVFALVLTLNQATLSEYGYFNVAGTSADGTSSSVTARTP